MSTSTEASDAEELCSLRCLQFTSRGQPLGSSPSLARYFLNFFIIIFWVIQFLHDSLGAVVSMVLTDLRYCPERST